MNKKIAIIISIIMSVVIGIVMTLTASILHGFSIRTIYLLLASFAIGFLVNILIPLDRISNWFASLFKIKNLFLNVAVGTILVNLIMTTIMSFSMTAISLSFEFPTVFFAFLADYPIMYLVSYVASYIATICIKLVLKRKAGMNNE